MDIEFSLLFLTGDIMEIFKYVFQNLICARTQGPK